MIEPIQGEAGVFPIGDEVLLAAREACDDAGALLVFDEIQTGMGRTGSLWAYEQLPVRPDVMTAAKALGGGLPVGACVTGPQLGDVFEVGDHGSTFAGAPDRGRRGAAPRFDVIDDAGAPAAGARARRAVDAWARRARGRSPRSAGAGCWSGVTLADGLDAFDVARRALEAGLVINVPGPGMLRFLPPLVIGDDDVDAAMNIMRNVLG